MSEWLSRPSRRAGAAVSFVALSCAACSLVFPPSEYDRGGGAGAGGASGASDPGGAGGAGGTGGAGGLSPTCGALPPVSEIVDTFDGGLQSPSLALFGACVSASGGEVIAAPSGLDDFCWVSTLGSHRLACDALTVRVGPTLTAELGAQTFIYLHDTGGAGDQNLILEGGGFQFTPPIPLQNSAYDPMRDLYWRLRAGVPDATGATTLAFDTSEDGVTWTERGAGPAAIPLTDVTVDVGAGVYMSVPTPPGEAHIDCFNAPAPCP